LRTNEIIGFHAFLSSLDDNYAANYESSDSYGRIDPVRIYKNTERSIEMSFYVASTNKSDFDEMWWKINKLTTLLYPQWSAGSERKIDSKNQFIQPFSQIPTASPLIRLRVGDVIKSNYSKFGLSRLFGIGTTKFIQSRTSDTVSDTVSLDNLKETLESIKKIINDWTLDPDVNGETFGFPGKNEQAILMPSKTGYYLEAEPTGNLLAKAAAIIQSGSARKKLRTLQEYAVTITKKDPRNINQNSTPIGTASKTLYTVKFSATESEAPPGFTGISVLATHADLKIDPVALIQGNADAIVDLFPANVANFMKSENNPIVSAFDSVKGRGLGGVITSMNFKWIDDKIVWETDALGRAPKFCEIKISFIPIHDIPPGLDSDGFNRAPIYPVGDIMQSFLDSADTDEVKVIMRKCLDALYLASETTNVGPFTF
jgi:hypothetical protein